MADCNGFRVVGKDLLDSFLERAFTRLVFSGNSPYAGIDTGTELVSQCCVLPGLFPVCVGPGQTSRFGLWRSVRQGSPRPCGSMDEHMHISS